MKPLLSLQDIDYFLPPELIAQKPAMPRHSSRLLVVERKTKKISHHIFQDLPLFLEKGDLLVRNNTRVLPMRIFAKKNTGARMEILLMYPEEEGSIFWKGLIKGRKASSVPYELALEEENIPIQILSKEKDGVYKIGFPEGVEVKDLLEKTGYMPLPPYIKRDYKEAPNPQDRALYQTVYASQAGAYAAPTAGLHFTEEVFEAVKKKEARWADVTLHVGLGTFKPIEVEKLEDHPMHQEYYSIPEETLSLLSQMDRPRQRIFAVGTTSVRTLEAFSQNRKREGWTNLFIYPPYQIQSVDCLLTNFHLPKSTLLLLVSAFAGWDLIRQAYKIAIEEKYRFFSYGDAMLIL